VASSVGYNKLLIKKIEEDPEFKNFGDDYVAEVLNNFDHIFKEFYEEKVIEKVFKNGINILTKTEF
tara:strand:- start:395 stop:592 length:198 start_codon:yes stop_codon:yes gene_type:complete